MRKMTMTSRRSGSGRSQALQAGLARVPVPPDSWVLIPSLLLLAIGIVMVGSASIAVAEGQGVPSYHYLLRHLVFIAIGIVRFINFQAVEAVKLLTVFYVAGYLARKADSVHSRFFDTLKPLLFAALLSAILLLQPDMGSAAVITAIVAGMVWLAGAAWRHIFVLGMLTLPAFGFAAMEPYRLRRIVSFMDPWADPFASGFQLTQALIAVGRGELFGVGIGASIQKLFYLPEAHTDFIFAVLAEEIGLAGVVLVLLLFLLLVTRIMVIGIMAHRGDRPFAAFVAYGIGLWIGLQALVSVGVNLGVLPTKGLTLPLISSGGSSMLMTLVALGVVLRIKYELDRANGAVTVRRKGPRETRS
jgi:cell division protein FtsW